MNYRVRRAGPPVPPTFRHVGCHRDGQNDTRDLPVNAGDELGDDSPGVRGGCRHFGLQDGDDCFWQCGDACESQGRAPEADCNMPCPRAHKATMCEGVNRNSIYVQEGGAAQAWAVPASFFLDEVQPTQMHRLNVSAGLTHGGWNTSWAKASVTAPILLPHGLMLQFGLCRISTQTCMWSGDKSEIDDGNVRLGLHAYDHSHTQLYYSAPGATVSFETSQAGGEAFGDLLVRASPAGAWNLFDYTFLVSPVFCDVGVNQASRRLPGTLAAEGSIKAQAGPHDQKRGCSNAQGWFSKMAAPRRLVFLAF